MPCITLKVLTGAFCVTWVGEQVSEWVIEWVSEWVSVKRNIILHIVYNCPCTKNAKHKQINKQTQHVTVRPRPKTCCGHFFLWTVVHWIPCPFSYPTPCFLRAELVLVTDMGKGLVRYCDPSPSPQTRPPSFAGHCWAVIFHNIFKSAIDMEKMQLYFQEFPTCGTNWWEVKAFLFQWDEVHSFWDIPVCCPQTLSANKWLTSGEA